MNTLYRWISANNAEAFSLRINHLNGFALTMGVLTSGSDIVPKSSYVRFAVALQQLGDLLLLSIGLAIFMTYLMSARASSTRYSLGADETRCAASPVLRVDLRGIISRPTTHRAHPTTHGAHPPTRPPRKPFGRAPLVRTLSSPYPRSRAATFRLPARLRGWRLPMPNLTLRLVGWRGSIRR
jgi:hypothetical protein